MLRHVLTAACCAAIVLSLSCDNNTTTNNNNNSNNAGAKKTIGVVPKGTAHIFWRSVKAGADKAGKELGVDIKWDGPPSEAQRAKQIEIIDTMQTRGIDALVVAPLDHTAITPTMEKAKKSMPVVVFDSGSTFTNYDAYVATDNYKGGQLAGRHMLKLIGDKEVELAMIRYDSASDSTNKREQGFLDAIKGNAKIKVYSEQFAGESANKAADLMSNMLSAHPKITAVFASNESTARGALGALEKAGLAGKIIFIGFDSSPELLGGLEKGQIQALVLQDPVKMGYLSVKAAVAAIRKESVAKEQPIEPVLATPENMNKPEVKSLLRPEI